MLESLLISLSLSRVADLTKMDDVARGNKLPYDRSGAVEYAIHGKWARTEDDSNGVFGTWYIGLKDPGVATPM